MAREICVKKLSQEGNFFSVGARLLEGKVGQVGRMGQGGGYPKTLGRSDERTQTGAPGTSTAGPCWLQSGHQVESEP